MVQSPIELQKKKESLLEMEEGHKKVTLWSLMDGLSLHNKKLKGKNVLKKRNITSSGSQSVGQGPAGGFHNLFRGPMRSKLFS